MANNFKPWVDTPTAGQQVQSALVFASDTQRVVGFTAGDPASALRVNSALRQANIVIAGLMQFCDEVKTLPDGLSLLSTVTQVKNAIKDSIELLHDTTLTSAKSYTDARETAIDTKIFNVQNQVTGNKNDITTLIEQVDEHDAEISALSGGSSTLTTRVETLETKVNTAPSTTQSNSTTTVPSDKLLKESSFARVYREATELSGVTYPISIANLLTAIIAANPLNSIFVIGLNAATETKVTGLPATYGALTIIVPGETALGMRVEFSKELGDNTTQQYVGNITRSGSTVSSVAWDMVITDNGSQTFTGKKTFAVSPDVPTPNGSDAAVPKSYVDSIGFAKVYRSLSEVAGITPSTVTPVELAAAMAQGSILIAEIIQSDAPMLYPSGSATTAGGLFVRKAGNNAVLFEFNVKIPESTTTYQYTGIVRLSDTGTYQWSGWVRDTWAEAMTIGVEATDLNTLIEDGGKWRGTTTALAANCSNKPESSPTGFVLECVEMRRSDTPYRTKMQTYRSNNGIWYRIGAQATSVDAVTWNAWANLIVSTGAQTIGGAKTFTDNVTVSSAVPKILIKSTTDIYNVTSSFLATGLECTDKNGVYTGAFRTFRSGDGSTSVNMTARNQANSTMTVGLRGFTNGTWALLGDAGVVDIGAANSRFKDLYLAGNINAAGTITGNVVNSPYKLIASGTLAANASLTLNNIILNDDYAGRPLYMRIWGEASYGEGSLRLNGYLGTVYTQYPLHSADNNFSTPTSFGFFGAAPVYDLDNYNASDWIHIQYISKRTGTTHTHSLIAQQTHWFIDGTDADILTDIQKIVAVNQTTMPTIAFTTETAALNYAIYTANY